MRRFWYVIGVLLFVMGTLSGCGQGDLEDSDHRGEEGEDGKISVVTTIFPGYDFTREIAGDCVDLKMLLPPGSESHSFEPTPQDIIAIQNCDLFLYVGGESDVWVENILDSMDTSGIMILSMMDLVDVVEEELKEGMEAEYEDGGHGESNHDESGHGDEMEYDEHVWTSPINAIRITEAIADALCVIDEENADLFQRNSEDYIGELEELDRSFREVVQNVAGRTLIFGDRFPFRYFVEEYGLDYFAAFPGCATETEASAKTVAFLIDKVKEENIPVVFHIEFSNEKMADTICESTGAKKLLFHSAHNVTKGEFDEGISYLEIMRGNVERLGD